MSTISSIAVRAAISAARMGFPTLYGRLPTTSARPSRGRAIAPYSHTRASASTTSIDGKRAESRPASPRSISRATTRPARRTSSPVSAPSPGPISTTRSAAVGATRSTIARATPASRRKCWPRARRLVARTPSRLEVGEERRVDPAHLGDRRLAVARVVDDVVRDLRLLRDRQLARDPPLGLRGAEPVARREAPGLRRLVGDDHDETVHGRGVPALDDQGRVE